MRFLIDRCAGTFIAEWLRTQGHDVVESRERGPDPGDRVLLEWAAQESRILITIDTDFGQLVFLEGQSQQRLDSFARRVLKRTSSDHQRSD